MSRSPGPSAGRPVYLSILLIVVLAAACGTSGASVAPRTLIAASPNASSGPLTVRSSPLGPASAGFVAFVSSRHGYALAHPSGWSATEAPGTGGVHPGEPGLDTFDGRTGRILTVAVEPVGSRANVSTWTCAINLHLAEEHRLKAGDETQLVVGGRPGSLRDYHLTIAPYVIHYLTIQVVRGSTGFTFTLESTTSRDAEDEALLREIAATIRFASE